MTKERYNLLMRDEAKLTPEEFAVGWHFCDDWDGLLLCPEDMEAMHCSCRREDGTHLTSEEAKVSLRAEYDRDRALVRLTEEDIKL